MAEQPRPCPFCGSTASPKRVLGQHHEITCDNENCGAHIWDANPEKWNRRTPGPATRTMLESLGQNLADLQDLDPSLDLSNLGNPYLIAVKAFLAEWGFPCVVVLRPDPITPPAPEQPSPASPWACSVCGQPVRIADDLRPYHVAGPGNHEAELSSEDMKILADGLRMSD